MAEYIKREEAMNVKEKLIEILRKPIFPHELVDPTEAVADYLLDSGVMVQEWISVKDRLPEEGEYVLCVLKGFNYGGKIQVCKFVPADKFKDKPYFEHFRNGFPSVTHWMPLPQPPKGE